MRKPVCECVSPLNLEHGTTVSGRIRPVNAAVGLGCGLTPQISDALMR
jgi:hypothetical protein